ncbi:MAG TPA: hypothetical protein VKS60_09245 [Stellaceae bacterium]|nr:hypothetical protein [Stellaceae bacterium]
MPNKDNVDRPITLMGIGRSGTSLLESCFRRQKTMQTLGETGALIFGTAAGAPIAEMPSKQAFEDRYAYCGHTVRTLFVNLEPSDRDTWFHKPIGLPKFIRWGALPGEKTPEGFPLEWYWRVLESAFPEGAWLCCLRNPWDVVLSWERFAGWRQEDIWRDVGIVYRILRHRMERFRKILLFSDLVDHGETTLKDLFALLGLPWSDSLLEPFKYKVSVKPDHEIMKDYREAWGSARRPTVTDEVAELIVGTWKFAGGEFESPAQFQGVFPF